MKSQINYLVASGAGFAGMAVALAIASVAVYDESKSLGVALMWGASIASCIGCLLLGIGIPNPND